MKPNLRASAWMIAVAGLGLAAQIQAASINLNTGVDSSGNVLPDNSFEVRYSLSYRSYLNGDNGDPGTQTPVAIGPFNGGIPMAAMVADQSSSLFQHWVPDPAGAKWISPWTPGDPTEPFWNDPAGYYDYRISFNSPSAGSLSILAGFASDNTGWAYDNGVLQGSTGFGAFGGLTGFNLNVVPGNNVIDFVVWNPVWDTGGNPTGNPSGLLVQASFTIPDGGLTVALLGFALVGVEGLRRKLRK